MAEEWQGFNTVPVVPDAALRSTGTKRSYGTLGLVGTLIGVTALLLGAAILLWSQFRAATGASQTPPTSPGSTEANQVLKAMFCPAGDDGAYHVLRRCPTGG